MKKKAELSQKTFEILTVLLSSLGVLMAIGWVIFQPHGPRLVDQAKNEAKVLGFSVWQMELNRLSQTDRLQRGRLQRGRLQGGNLQSSKTPSSKFQGRKRDDQNLLPLHVVKPANPLAHGAEERPSRTTASLFGAGPTLDLVRESTKPELVDKADKEALDEVLEPVGRVKSGRVGVDPWGRPYTYAVRSDQQILFIWSYGPNGRDESLESLPTFRGDDLGQIFDIKTKQ